MPQVVQYLRMDDTCPFEEAFLGLRDTIAKARIDSAIRKLERGLLPEVKPVGEGVHEARIDHGPGYRYRIHRSWERIWSVVLNIVMARLVRATYRGTVRAGLARTSRAMTGRKYRCPHLLNFRFRDLRIREGQAGP